MKKDKKWVLDKLNKIEPFEFGDGYRLGFETGIKRAKTIVEKLDEPEKVVIPRFVANYIELCKGENGDRQAYTEDNSELWFALGGDSCGMPNSVSDWLFNEEKVETFARAWLDGYEVEKEKLYYVKLPNTNSKSEYLYLAQGNVSGDCWFNSRLERLDYEANACKHKFTEQEIKDYDERYWPFAVEVVE